jgi:hypothetical protein
MVHREYSFYFFVFGYHSYTRNLIDDKSFVGLGIQCLEPVVGGKKSITFALKDLDYFDEFLLV